MDTWLAIATPCSTVYGNVLVIGFKKTHIINLVKYIEYGGTGPMSFSQFLWLESLAHRRTAG
jgi:hypothetical protein